MTTKEQEFGLPSIGIPAEVLFNSKLSHTEKILFGFIRNLSHSRRGCWATNRYLADLMECKERTISNGVTNLKKLEYIIVEQREGKNRQIHINPEYKSKYQGLFKGITPVKNYGGENDNPVKNYGGGSKILRGSGDPNYISEKERIKEGVANESATDPPQKTTKKKYTSKHLILARQVVTKQTPIFIKDISKQELKNRIEKSAATLEELERIDGYDFDLEIKPLILWAVEDEFWKYNLASLGSLRERAQKNGNKKIENLYASWNQVRDRQKKNGNGKLIDSDIHDWNKKGEFRI